MRKYVEPEMKVMAINLKENIASSCTGTVIIGTGKKTIEYCIKGNFIVGTFSYSKQGSHYVITTQGEPSVCQYSEDYRH